MADLNVIDESNLNDIMLTVGDADEAAAYFRGAVKKTILIALIFNAALGNLLCAPTPI